jgi:hypothetical protein
VESIHSPDLRTRFFHTCCCFKKLIVTYSINIITGGDQILGNTNSLQIIKDIFSKIVEGNPIRKIFFVNNIGFYLELEKNPEKITLLIFEAKVQLGTVKILKSRRTKVVPKKCSHLFRLQPFNFLILIDWQFDYQLKFPHTTIQLYEHFKIGILFTRCCNFLENLSISSIISFLTPSTTKSMEMFCVRVSIWF